MQWGREVFLSTLSACILHLHYSFANLNSYGFFTFKGKDFICFGLTFDHVFSKMEKADAMGSTAPRESLSLCYSNDFP